jgi:hypothetical protein
LPVGIVLFWSISVDCYTTDVGKQLGNIAIIEETGMNLMFRLTNRCIQRPSGVAELGRWAK